MDEDDITSTGRIRMRAIQGGEPDGVPVVLLHGIPTGPQLWRRVTPRLRGARVVAGELVGYADSIPQGRERDISVAAQADYLLELLDALGIDRAILVGHDLGGGVAQIAAVRRPSACAGLVLTNSISYDSWPIAPVKAMRAGGSIVEHTPIAVFRKAIEGFIRIGHDDGDVATESARIHFDPYARHDGASDFLRQIESLDCADTMAIAEELPKLHVPARIVWGAADEFQPVEYAERLARDLDAPLHRIEDGRHFTPEDHPEEVASAIQQLVDGLADAASTDIGATTATPRRGG